MDRAIDPAYLRDQYGTTDKLDARIEAHQRCSERPDDYLDWVLDRLDPQPGNLAVDVGCGYKGVALTTNAKDHSARLMPLHRTAAQTLDYQPAKRVTDRFDLSHLALVEEVFPTAECFIRQDSFILLSTEAACWASPSPQGGHHRWVNRQDDRRRCRVRGYDGVQRRVALGRG